MASHRTRALATGATVVTGLLAGANLDRAAIQMPAWGRLGPEAWAAYSRHADLENGRFVYPAEALGAAALLAGTAVSYHLDAGVSRRAAAPIYAAAGLAAAGLLATTQAAPAMLSLRDRHDDPEAVPDAFTRFRFWGTVRGAAQILSFAASVWALAELCGGRLGEEEEEGTWSI